MEIDYFKLRQNFLSDALNLLEKSVEGNNSRVIEIVAEGILKYYPELASMRRYIIN